MTSASGQAHTPQSGKPRGSAAQRCLEAFRASLPQHEPLTGLSNHPSRRRQSCQDLNQRRAGRACGES